MATQQLIHYVAMCHDCGKRCEARNAQAWAHRHANHNGHDVELQLAWTVYADGARKDSSERAVR